MILPRLSLHPLKCYKIIIRKGGNIYTPEGNCNFGIIKAKKKRVIVQNTTKIMLRDTSLITVYRNKNVAQWVAFKLNESLTLFKYEVVECVIPKYVLYFPRLYSEILCTRIKIKA